MTTQGYLSEHRRSHTDELTNYFLNVTLRHRLCSKSFVAIPEKRRIDLREPTPPIPPAPPAPPGFLMPAAKDEWWRVAPQLHVLGLLTAIDVMVLAAYCQACGRWQQAEDALAAMAERDPETGGCCARAISTSKPIRSRWS